MDNVFSKAPGAGSHRKFSNQAKVPRFSPSYGVHQGLIKDPNWPPAEFPVEGLATSRRFRRIPASFQVQAAGGEPFTVTGNLSSGGAMFATSKNLSGEEIEVGYGGYKATARVIAAESRGSKVVYRARFTNLDAAGEIWIALMKTF